VSTAAEAEKAAQATRLPPRGTRSFGPSRAYRYGVETDYMQTVNDSVLCMVIIETAAAVRNIDEILAVDGLDAAIIGPADLSISLGVGLNMRHAQVDEATETLIAAGKKAGKPIGIGFYNDMDMMGRRVAQGARILLAGMDEGIVKEGYENLLKSAAPLR
jgi:2-keto-3-deoxy-L-rhamnonate aldolase RhmA